MKYSKADMSAARGERSELTVSFVSVSRASTHVGIHGAIIFRSVFQVIAMLAITTGYSSNSDFA